MEENMVDAAEINSIAFLNKKRKIQAELPLPKHVCWAQKIEQGSNTEQKKARISISAINESILKNASSLKSESISIIHEELNSLYHDYGLDPSDDYEDELLEFGIQDDVKDLDVLVSNAEEGSKKLTIDKEFEEYFSMLML
ncbi:hypothetical protein CASFOL_027699 [Castilleja foliolosa]|uniref:Uncharacterized protein n=1 Tax=Castilleja foliolosa TaxID=1961234 RepID=A0ABD3CGD2_9LAMI